MSRVVLDASALLALLNEEPGAEEVEQRLPDSVIGAVNLSEVVAKLAEVGMSEKEIQTALDGLGLQVEAFGSEDARLAGLLRPATKRLGLSLGDRACLALAGRLRLPAVTRERTWKSLDIGVKVLVVR